MKFLQSQDDENKKKKTTLGMNSGDKVPLVVAVDSKYQPNLGE